MSKSGQPLAATFRRSSRPLRALKAKRFVLDGEIVVPVDGELSFDALLQRIHPAKSRVTKLSEETPGVLLVFDLLVDARGTDLTARAARGAAPNGSRRSRRRTSRRSGIGVELSPATTRLASAQKWLAGREGTDGVMAKRLDLPYTTGERTGDGEDQAEADGRLRRRRLSLRDARESWSARCCSASMTTTAFCITSASRRASRRRSASAITPIVEKLAGGEGFTGRAPGGPSRWSTARSSEWEALKPKLVVEVGYDHFTNGRFRHGTKFMRWRPEKAPAQCLLSQVAEARVLRRSPTDASTEILRFSLSVASPLMIDRHDTSGPLRRPFSVTLMPSGAMAMV